MSIFRWGAIVATIFALPTTALAATSCGSVTTGDDTACLEAAFSSGPKVSFDARRAYNISKPLIIGDGVTLNGNGATITSDAPIGVLVVRGSHLAIRDLNVQSRAGGSTLNRVGIMFAPGASDVLLTNSTVSGRFGIAIMITGGQHQRIKLVRNVVDPRGGSIGYGILVNALNLGSNAYPRDITISNNTVTNVSSDAIEINSPVADRKGYPDTVSNVVIQNNTLSAPNATGFAAGFCVGIAGAYNVQVKGNRMSDCKWQGVHIEDHAERIDIVNNVIAGTIGPKAGESGWKLYSSGVFALNSRNIRLLGNTISNSYSKGIEMGFNPGGMNSKVTIAGNTIANSGASGILFSGNVGADVQSTIGASDGYPDNTIRGSGGGVDIAACVQLRGSQARSAKCGN
jgi:hypothetical protein